MRQRGKMLRPGAVVVGGVILAVLTTACGASGTAGSADRLGTPATGGFATTGVSPSGGSGTGPVAPTDGPEGAVGRVVLRAYQAWWDAQTAAFSRLDSDGTQISTYSTGQALSGALASLHQLHEAKLVMIGSPRNAAVVKTVSNDSAVIEDCLDVTDWHQADATTKSVKDPQQRLARYPATATLRNADNRWLIVEFTREAGRTC